MIVIDDPTIRSLRRNYRMREWAVLVFMLISIGLTLFVVWESGAMGSSTSVYSIALMWIFTAAAITWVITVREIGRIQETQQSLNFNIHSGIADPAGAAALSELKVLAKKANTRSTIIAVFVGFLAIYSLVFLIGNVLLPQLLKVEMIELIKDHVDIAHMRAAMMNVAIIFQLCLVGLVIWYDSVLYRMNHVMKRAYRPEIFTDAAKNLREASEDMKEKIDSVRSVKIDLEIAALSLIAIDCPIFVAVSATAILEIWFMTSKLPEALEVFAIGVSTGALALHVIAANVMFMILPRLNSTTPSFADSVIMPGTAGT